MVYFLAQGGAAFPEDAPDATGAATVGVALEDALNPRTSFCAG